MLLVNQSINQSINIFNVLGGNWDPTDKKFSSVNSYRHDLLPTCKAFPKATTTCIWFTQSHKVCNSTTVLQEVQMLCSQGKLKGRLITCESLCPNLHSTSGGSNCNRHRTAAQVESKQQQWQWKLERERSRATRTSMASVGPLMRVSLSSLCKLSHCAVQSKFQEEGCQDQ